jgi:hypothetical protein
MFKYFCLAIAILFGTMASSSFGEECCNLNAECCKTPVRDVVRFGVQAPLVVGERVVTTGVQTGRRVVRLGVNATTRTFTTGQRVVRFVTFR